MDLDVDMFFPQSTTMESRQKISEKRVEVCRKAIPVKFLIKWIVEYFCSQLAMR